MEVYQFKNHFDKYKFYNHSKVNFKYLILWSFVPLWKGSLQMVCEKEVEIIVEEVEVLKRYLKNSFISNDKDKIIVFFHIHVNQ